MNGDKSSKWARLLSCFPVTAMIIVLVTLVIVAVSTFQTLLIVVVVVILTIFLSMLITDTYQVRYPSHLRIVGGVSLEKAIASYLQKLGYEQASLHFVMEGEETRHEFDCSFKKRDDVYLLEVKRRPLIPSDLENYAAILEDVRKRNRSVKRLFLFTTGETSEPEKNTAAEKGIQIVTLDELGLPKDFVEDEMATAE